MNPDVTYASCDAPQEKTDKEVELDEDGNEVRERAIVLFLFRRQMSFLSFLFRRSFLLKMWSFAASTARKRESRSRLRHTCEKKEEKHKKKKPRFFSFVELR